ncbi:MAG: hypothetical protein ACRDT6_27790 [Micromonosporaceae bacterium]
MLDEATTAAPVLTPPAASRTPRAVLAVAILLGALGSAALGIWRARTSRGCRSRTRSSC